MSKPFAPRKFTPAGWVGLGSIVAVAVLAAVGIAGSANSNSHQSVMAAASVASKPTAPARLMPPGAHARVRASYEALPLAFEANEGQADAQVKYLARGNGYTLFLTSGDAVLSLASGARASSRPKEIMEQRLPGYSLKTKKLVRKRQSLVSKRPASVASLRLHLLGGNDHARIAGEGLLASRVNYFIGNDPHRWQKSISEYARVSYKDVYPGVDLAYHGHENHLEFDFVVAPGADPSPIAVSFPGARHLTTDKLGNLVLASSAGDLTLHKPVAYQEHDGLRQPVEAKFVLQANHIRFELGNYDRSRELVVDPQLSYASYLGGNADDEGFGIAVDGGGNSYITGESDSTSGFPGGISSISGFDVFVIKINSDGTLGYTTFVGGSADDLGAAIAVDASGAAYVGGITTSTDFPTSTGAPQTTSGGGGTCTTGNGSAPCTDGFVFKLDSTGGTGAGSYSTYVGGANDDGVFGIAVDASGNAYVTGFTFSSDFPLINAAYTVLNNNVISSPPFQDAFVTEIDATGTSFAYSTYLGGLDNDFGNGIAVDSAGNAFVAGATSSIDFPVTSGAFQITCGTDANCNAGSGLIFSDAFVTEIPAGGGQTTGPIYSTYLGGSSDDFGLAIALDTLGNAYVTGQTTDDNLATLTGDFPITLGSFQQNYGGGNGNANAGGNAFVTKVNATGTGLVYSSYLGGSTSDVGFGIALDAGNNAYVTGSTLSADFPVNGGFQNALGGSSDAFVTEVAANGGSLVYSSYLGGTGDENYDTSTATFIGGAVAVDSSASVHLAGTTTSSSDFPVTSGTIVQSSYGGDPFDAFAATVLSAAAPDFTISGTALSPASISPGSAATSTIAVAALNGYSNQVDLSCSVTSLGSPAPTCTFSANSVANGSGSSTLTISTTGAAASLYRTSRIFYAMWLPIVGLSLLGMRFSSTSSRRKRQLGFLVLGLVMTTLFFLPACGGSSSNNGGGGGGCTGCTPAGSYAVTIIGTDHTNASLAHSVTPALTVTVN